MQLLPSHDAVSLITVLPEQLQSPLLTAEGEDRLGAIERGQLAPEEFLDGISTMLKELVGTYQVIKGTEYLFTPPREVVGKCPRCGGEVAETILDYNTEDPLSQVYTHEPPLIYKLEMLAKKNPQHITRKDAHNFTVPKRCVSVREPYSAERRKAASERAKAAGYQPAGRKSGRKPSHSSFVRTGSGVIAYCPITTIC